MSTDPFLAHEALDRASLLAEIWERHICHHSFVAANPDLASAAAQIGDMIGDFYQQVGARQIDGSPGSG